MCIVSYAFINAIEVQDSLKFLGFLGIEELDTIFNMKTNENITYLKEMFLSPLLIIIMRIGSNS